MKVAIFTDTFLPNRDGVVTSICNQIKGLISKGIEVVVFAPGEKTKLDNFRGARVYYIRGLDLLQYPGYRVVLPDKFLSKILAYLEIEEPDIYHIHSPFSLGVAGAMFAVFFKKPQIATFHTYLEEYAAYLTNGKFPNAVKEFFSFGSWNYFKIVFFRSSYVIAPTNEIAKILKKHGFREVTVIPSPVDFDSFDRQKRIDIRRKNKIPKSAKLILCVGRLGFEKKLNVLFDAFKMLGKEYYLLVVGKGPFAGKYENYVRKNRIKNVRFTGYVDDKELPSYYSNCDIFVNPSDTETQGLVHIEAMHFGKPVVGADSLGVKDIILDYKNGLKFTPGDADDLQEKIEEIMNDKVLYRKLCRNGKVFAKKFSIENCIKKTIKLYKSAKYERSIFNKWRRNVNKRFKSILKFV